MGTREGPAQARRGVQLSHSSAFSAFAPAEQLWRLRELKGHTGRKVEIAGEIEGEIEKGKIEIERMDNGMIKLQAKYDGKTVTALLASVPAAVGTAGAAGDKEVEIDYIVRKVDVKSVRTIADNCR